LAGQPKNDLKPMVISAAETIRHYCRPRDATIGNVADMLCKSLSDNTSQRKLGAAALRDDAM
jgi:hypothetical protein